MKLVIIGAGYAGLTTALHLARARVPARIVVVNDGPEHQLMTQLHKVAAGTVPPDIVSLSLERLLRNTGVELVIGRVASIEPEHNRVMLYDGEPLAYDRLVVALGSYTETFGIPGVMEHALHMQPLAEALRLRRTIGDRLRKAAERDDSTGVQFAIVGGGLTGVEFAGELADALPDLSRQAGIDAAHVDITLLEAGPRLLPGLAPFLGDESAAVLHRKGVDVRTGTKIAAVTAEGVVVEGDTGPNTFAADDVVWTAGVRGHPLTEAAFRSGPRGRALVDEFLRAVDYDNVYIIGDNARAVSKGAADAAAPTAQNAVQQAAVVADNIVKELRDQETTPTPYVAKPLGLFVSVGQGEAVGELAFGDFWRPRLSGMPAYALKWASEQRYKLGIGAGIGASKTA